MEAEMQHEESILVVGAGIGGLTLAVALQRQGIPVRVLERASAVGPVGAGLVIQPNAIVLLESLGLAERVRSAGAILTEGSIRGADGRVLSRLEAAAPGRQMIGIHRAELHRVLHEALEGEVTFGFEVAGCVQHDAGVTLRATDGREVPGAIAVGADGLRSAMRAQVLHDGEPVYSGYTSWRGVCDATGVRWAAHEMVESWGSGRRFGIVPIGGGRLYWFATMNAPAGGSGAGRELLLETFAGFHDPIAAILRATPEQAILRTDIHDRDPADRWSEGRVTLLGDAAHAMTPNMGQGACQAIEDAYVLAEALARRSTPAETFAAYEGTRRERANQFVRWSRSIGRMGQIDGGMSCTLRNLAMRTTPSWVLERRMREAFTPRSLGASSASRAG